MRYYVDTSVFGGHYDEGYIELRKYISKIFVSILLLSCNSVYSASISKNELLVYGYSKNLQASDLMGIISEYLNYHSEEEIELKFERELSIQLNDKFLLKEQFKQICAVENSIYVQLYVDYYLGFKNFDPKMFTRNGVSELIKSEYSVSFRKKLLEELLILNLDIDQLKKIYKQAVYLNDDLEDVFIDYLKKSEINIDLTSCGYCKFTLLSSSEDDIE